jgi:transposase
VKEYQRHRLGCHCCGTQTCASLPPGIPQGQSGPPLIALVGLLMGYYRQSKRRTALFLQEFLKMPCSEGLPVKMHCQGAQALEEPYEELKATLGEQSMVLMDKTPTKQAQKKEWLWTVVAPKFAVLATFPSREAEALDKLLGDGFDGVIHCDRAKMNWQAPKLQWCWAHLKRDFQALIDYPDNQVKRLGYDLMRQVRLIFKYWRRYQNEEIGWESFRRCMRPVQDEVENLLGRGRSVAINGLWACVGNSLGIRNGCGPSPKSKESRRRTTRRNEPFARQSYNVSSASEPKVNQGVVFSNGC